MRKVLKTVVAILFFSVLAGALYQYDGQVRVAIVQTYARFYPCAMPVTYRLGSIDPQFRVSQSRFLADIKLAEAVWEDGSKRDLFQYDPQNGAVVVNLVYDYRQQAIDQLQSIGITISDTQASYDQLKAKYDALHSTYDARKAALESEIADFQKKQDAYNKEVQMWNARGGAPKNVYDQLQNEKVVLDQERAQLQAKESAFNSDVDTMNALAMQLNRLAGVLNINAQKYNTIGASTGGEFEEGLYTSSLGDQTIDIYEFGDRAELVRVLAHELGHALGLEHVDDPSAIMYKLNQSKNGALTSADLAELTRVCGK